MAKLPRFAKAFCRPQAHRRNGYQATFANAAEFFNSLLVLLSQKVAFWELGILDNFGRFVFRHEELRWITQ